jgi:ribosome-binding protein aMBF1 (putative translation factor)
MLSGPQVRAARAALGVSVAQLAHAARVSESTVRRIEQSRGDPSSSVRSLLSIERALTARGVVFADELRPDGSVIRAIFFTEPPSRERVAETQAQFSFK